MTRLSFCLQCGEPIISKGRTDRKFCCAECKNLYHNKGRIIPWQNYAKKVNRILETNAMILRHLHKIGIGSVGIVEMKRMGFEFDYCTSFAKEGGRNRYTCYDMQYDVTPSRVINISKLDDVLKLFVSSGDP